jgi:hypothetical protein
MIVVVESVCGSPTSNGMNLFINSTRLNLQLLQLASVVSPAVNMSFTRVFMDGFILESDSKQKNALRALLAGATFSVPAASVSFKFFISYWH